MARDRDAFIRDVFALRKQGWLVEWSGRSHLKVVSPGGETATFSGTPHPSGLQNAKNKLRKMGGMK